MIMPVYGCRAHPQDFDPKRSSGVWRRSKTRPDEVPVVTIAEEAFGALRSGDVVGVVWRPRRWYPYAFVPLWIAALRACARGDDEKRRRWAAILRRASIVALLFEAVYLLQDFAGVGPTWLRIPECVVVWIVVGAILFWRPRGRRDRDDVGALVSSQALLGLCHALTFPLDNVWHWLGDGYSIASIASALGTNYKYGFWLAASAFLAAALPTYVVRPRDAPSASAAK
jgi:hypothetical protein